MTTQDILKLCGKGEQTPVQLKERVVDSYEMSKEMVCYANERGGGTIIVGMTVEKLFKNAGLIRPDDGITYAAILLFGKHTQRWLPTATVKCVSFVGNSQGGVEFRDKMDDLDADGGLLRQFDAMMSFLKRNLRNVQVEPGFNSLGQLEIPFDALSEICSNALLHRSYSREAPVRLFIFDNRVEIHSPGILPGGLQVEDVLMGTSFPRNRMVFTHGAFLLPYTGVGSGFIRVRELDDNMEVLNDEKRKEVIVTFWRGSARVTEQSNGADQKVTERGNGVTEHGNGAANPKDKPSGKTKDIINYCTVPRTAGEILARLGLTNQTKNRKKYINPLIQTGLLKLTIPDTPNDPNQKYVKVKH